MTTPLGAAPFTSILVLVGPSPDDDATIAKAQALAQHWDARLTLLSVVEPPRDWERMARIANVDAAAMGARLVDARRDELSALAVRSGLGVAPDLEVRTGKTFIEVIRCVTEGGHDLVIKTAGKLEGMRPFIFASTDQHLLRKCPAPVWLRLPGARAKARKIIAAVDIASWEAAEPDTQDALNRAVLGAAMAAAAVDGATVEAMHVWDALGESMVASWASDKNAAKRYREDAERAHSAALHALISQVGEASPAQVTVAPHLARGVAREDIPKYIRRSGADLLVIGTIARAGVPGLLIGNTAEDVLQRVDCSVLTVKPEGYVSPIA